LVHERKILKFGEINIKLLNLNEMQELWIERK